MDLGSSNRKSREGNSEHQADSCISHTSGNDAIIIEITNSQKSTALNKLASFYLKECTKDVNLVIAIDFDYQKSKKVTLITWRRNGRATNRYEQVLRNSDGVLVPGESLKISILDLARQEHIPPSLRDIVIEISVDKLNEIISDAETMEEFDKGLDQEIRPEIDLDDGGPANRTRSKRQEDLQTRD